METTTAYPLSWPTGWPRNKTRIRSRFGTYWKKPTVYLATQLILLELKRAGARDWNVIVSTNVPLKRDGTPYSNQKEPNDPGAAVYWKDRRKRQLVLACDKYSSVGENLYAIAKTIEATRAIERWGSVTAEQAFAGYARLQEKTEPNCWDVLDIPAPGTASFPITERLILSAFRKAATKVHPDTGNEGASSEAFGRVVRAKDTALQLIK